MTEIRGDGTTFDIVRGAVGGALGRSPFANPTEGFGGLDDSSLDSQVSKPLHPHEAILRWAYRGDRIFQNIINIPAKEMTRKWFDLEITDGDEDDVASVMKLLRRHKTRKKFREARQWAMLFGGAVIVMGLDDGMPLEEPVDFSKVKDIRYLEVLDRHQIQPDHRSVDLTRPEHYRLVMNQRQEAAILNPDGSPVSYSQPIHKSRILRFDGVRMPYLDQWENAGWHDSLLLSTSKYILDWFAANQHLLRGLKTFSVFVHSINNLGELLAAGHEELVKKHFQEVIVSLTTFNALLRDGSVQESEFKGRQFAGVAECLELVRDQYVSITGIPYYLLWGRVGRSGISDDGGAEKRAWAENVESLQVDEFQDQLEEQLLPIACQSALGYVPDNFEVHWNSLYSLDEKAKAEIFNINSQAWERLISAGVLLPQWVARAIATDQPLANAIVLEELEAKIEEDKKMSKAIATQQDTKNDIAEPIRLSESDELTDEEFSDIANGVFDGAVVQRAIEDWKERSPIVIEE